MNLNKLTEIRNLIGIEIVNSREMVGAKELGKLVRIAEELSDLIYLISNPKKYNKEKEKVLKSLNLGVKHV